MPIRYSTVVIENDKPGDRGQMRNEIRKEIKHDLTTIVDKCGPCAAIEPNLDAILGSRRAYAVPQQIYDHFHLGPQLETKQGTSKWK